MNDTGLIFTRRELAKLTLAATPLAKLMAAAKPTSKIKGVYIGAISYSWRSMPGANNDARKVLQYCLDSGIGAIELMDGPAEAFAGAPSAGRGGGFGGGFGGGGGMGRGAGAAPGAATGGGRAPGAGAPGGAAAGEGRGGAGRGPGGGRAQQTPEQLAERQKAAEELKKWRLSQSMNKFREMRKMFNDAGVTIYAHKQTPTMNMSDDEFDYFFQVGKALGANHLTIELPEDEAFLKRLGDFALKHKMMIGHHAHTQATPTLWDKALAASKGNGINFDVGHYFAGTGETPLPLMLKHAGRITSLHLKDRKKQGAPGGDNLPWGQGDTPLKEILQTMRKNKYKFPASIELEYRVPDGSDAVREVRKCLEFCKQALA